MSWHSGRQNGGVTRWHPVALISCANCNQIVTIGISRESRRRPRRRIESPRRPRMFTRCRLDATAHGSHPATASPTAFPSLPARSAVSPQGKGSRLRPRRPTGADAGKGSPMSERATAHARPRPQGGTVPAHGLDGSRSPRRGHRPGHGLDGSPEGDRATLPGFGSPRRPRAACSTFWISRDGNTSPPRLDVLPLVSTALPPPPSRLDALPLDAPRITRPAPGRAAPGSAAAGLDALPLDDSPLDASRRPQGLDGYGPATAPPSTATATALRLRPRRPRPRLRAPRAPATPSTAPRARRLRGDPTGGEGRPLVRHRPRRRRRARFGRLRAPQSGLKESQPWRGGPSAASRRAKRRR